jgi:hypothetical protein
MKHQVVDEHNIDFPVILLLKEIEDLAKSI